MNEAAMGAAGDSPPGDWLNALSMPWLPPATDFEGRL
jgi:hypothetical protein